MRSPPPYLYTHFFLPPSYTHVYCVQSRGKRRNCITTLDALGSVISIDTEIDVFARQTVTTVDVVTGVIFLCALGKLAIVAHAVTLERFTTVAI